MTSKLELRKAFRALLSSNVGQEGAKPAPEHQTRLNDRLVELLKDETGLWGAFQPCGFEPAILPALERLTNITWVFPRVEGEQLAFYLPEPHRASTEVGAMIPGCFGLLEPNPACARLVALDEIAGFLIPGLAFDRGGRRLGRGKGYYDRALGALAPGAGGSAGSGPSSTHSKVSKETPTPNAFKLGIAHDRQISNDEIPVESFDVLMDGVLTESQYFGRRPSRPIAGSEGEPLEAGPNQSERNLSWKRS